MKNFILAHDLGTTGNKATLYNAEGIMVASAFDGYETEFAHTGWAEQNPEDWWRAICASTRKLLAESHVRGEEIACIVFSGQMMGCVPLGKDARPLRNAIIWADQRAVDQENWIAERISRDDVYRITGHRLSASYTLPKMLWMRDNQPDLYRSAHKFVHAKDAIVARLTGEFVTDASDASGMNLYDLEAGRWSDAIIEAAGIDRNQLPDVHNSTDVIGGVLASVADEVGVPAGTPVIIGAGDGMCAAAGAGVLREGTAYNVIGSSSWIALSTSKPVYDPQQKTFTWAHIIPGMFSPCGTMQMAGAAYQWTRNQLCQVEVEAAKSLGISPYELMNLNAEKAAVGSNGLIFLPYLLGERSPRWNPRARGAFIGLTVRHTHAEIIRSVLEGITMNLKVILDAYLAQGVQISSMRVIGGGARGRLWNQIMADIYGLPVQRLAIMAEATSMGAALAGGVGIGLYKSWDMAEQMNPIVETIHPNPTAVAEYKRIYPIFEASYNALIPVYDMLAEL